jgi:hypothetical protein
VLVGLALLALDPDERAVQQRGAEVADRVEVESVGPLVPSPSATL